MLLPAAIPDYQNYRNEQQLGLTWNYFPVTTVLVRVQRNFQVWLNMWFHG